MDLVEEYCKKYSNWGKWGPDDQRGTANYITPKHVLEAMQLPKTGRVISLALPYDGNGSADRGFRSCQTDSADDDQRCGSYRISPANLVGGKPIPHGMGYSDDTVFMPLQCGTQWDALGHIFHNGRMWNDYDAAEVSSAGARLNGIEKLKDTLAGRGVLLDVARSKGLENLKRGYPITGED